MTRFDKELLAVGGTRIAMVQQTTFHIAHMDCAAEEQLVRMALADLPEIQRLNFDLAARTVVVVHRGSGEKLATALGGLGLGATAIGQGPVTELPPERQEQQQRTVLLIVLVINAAMFLIELGAGMLAGSLGLIADSLDMLADAFVYGLSLIAIGRPTVLKKRIARWSGYGQLVLAVAGGAEVLRRFLGAGGEPVSALMIGTALLALAGNVVSLLVLARTQRQEAHIKASWIFTTNDVLVNLGVILAGVLVAATGSRLPDLVVGAIVFAVVGSGAWRILRLAR